MTHPSNSAERRSLTLGSGERLAYFEAGSGPDVLLIHGALVTSHDMVASLMEPLAAHFHVVAVDRPGHGRSTRPRGAGSLAAQAAPISEGAAALGLERPVLVGQSLGAAVAVQMALDSPGDIGGVVAIAPAVTPELRIEQALFGPRALLRVRTGHDSLDRASPDGLALPLLWRKIFSPDPVAEAFDEGMAFDEVWNAEGMMAIGEDALALTGSLALNALRYGACETPIRVICGDGDIVLNPVVHGRALTRLAPNATFTRAAGHGHMLHHFEAGLIVEMVRELASQTADA
jgi:pimeloyl-ACP methyl ester carboxylesterase